MAFCGAELARKVGPAENMSYCLSEMYVSAVNFLAFSGPLVLMSGHINPDKKHKAHLRKLIEMLEQAHRERPIIIGGDFNACRHYDVVFKKNVYAWFFKAMEEIGFIDCHYRLHGKEKQTYWSKKTTEPYQDDHFFVSAALGSRISSCDVLPYDPTGGISDHGPVELVIGKPW